MKPILVIGNCAVDVLAVGVDDFPPPGGTRTFERLIVAAGGCAANVALALGRLGVGCDFVTRVGQDSFGSLLIDELEEHEVGVGGVIVDSDAPTPFTFVTVASDGRRSFFHCRGTNDRIRRSDVQPSAIEGRSLVMVSGAMGLGVLDGAQTAEILAAAQRHGARTLLDTIYLDDLSHAEWMERLGPALPHLDVFAPSLAEGCAITRESDPHRIAARLLEFGPRNVVLKIGARGALVTGEDADTQVIPAVPVAAVVDETGAGDTFCAGLLAGLVEGATLAESTRLAAAVAAFCVESVGATTGVPNLKTVKARIA